MLYQLSYFRKNTPYQNLTLFGSKPRICNSNRRFLVGRDGFEPPKA